MLRRSISLVVGKAIDSLLEIAKSLDGSGQSTLQKVDGTASATKPGGPGVTERTDAKEDYASPAPGTSGKPTAPMSTSPTAPHVNVAASQLHGALYEWPVDRSSKIFRGGVIQVGQYAPATHALLFRRVLSALTTGHIRQVGTESRAKRTIPRFDLVTFPEAFLPLHALGETLRSFKMNVLPTFIHVGLRRNATERISDGHLIPVPEMITFVDGLLSEGVVTGDDVEQLRGWLRDQPTDGLYNFGCVFGVDANAALRVCLHPKVVRSKLEEGALQHAHMTEANLISIVILDPIDRDQMPIYVQPLLCSDALFVPMDQPTNHHPLLAITSRVPAFRRSVEHVDIVSIASCTRESSDKYGDETLKQQWQHEFLDSARRIAEKDDARSHHGAIIVKANYQHVQGLPNAGLSGFFFPHALREPHAGAHIHQSVYATTEFDDSRWLAHREVEHLRKDWKSTKSRGYVIAMADATAHASLLAFEVTRLSRAARGWGVESMLRTVHVYDLASGEVDVFVERGTE